MTTPEAIDAFFGDAAAGLHDPALLGDLPSDPVVVGYAPQLELIRRSALTISHGGLNTALESLACGVPMVVLIIGREFAVTGLRSIAAAEGYTIKASDLGKTEMIFDGREPGECVVEVRGVCVGGRA